MSKFIRNMICILGICSLFLVGCSNGLSEKEVETNKGETVVNSPSEIENNDESNKEQGVDPSEETENEIDSSSDNSNTSSTKQMYIEKLNELDTNLKISLEEKYASPKTQDMLDAANEEFSQWDYMLNEIYSTLEVQLSQEDMNNLRIEELNWINTRDLKSEAAANEFKGGTMEPLNRVMSLVTSTKERCYELVNQYMK